MLRLAGWWWIGVSALHALGGIILYYPQWQEIAQAGWFNVVAPDPFTPIFSRETAFYLSCGRIVSLGASSKVNFANFCRDNFANYHLNRAILYAYIWFLAGTTAKYNDALLIKNISTSQ
ncbi:MAG: hypothetical protein RLZZ499_3338 [Cyanobacteriota bacterium]|jgi:hypothetical protein